MMCLGMGLLFLGQGDAVEGALAAIKVNHWLLDIEPIRSHNIIITFFLY